MDGNATGYSTAAAAADAGERLRFLRQTYLHLALAILAFAAVERLQLDWPGAVDLAQRMTAGYMWLVVLLAYAGVPAIADQLARSDGSIATQYLGLGLFVIAKRSFSCRCCCACALSATPAWCRPRRRSPG